MAIDLADDETKVLPGITEAEKVVEKATEVVEETEETLISIGEASPASEEVEAETEADTPLIKDMRKRLKETARRTRELEEENNRLKQVTQPAKVELGAKPTLESCEYDADKFENELTAYHERKRKVDDEAQQRVQEAENEKKAWQQKLAAYETAKTTLKVKDFDDAEENVKGSLSISQQSIILQGAKDSSLIVYALGKNDEELQRLAKIKDPIKFAFEVAKIEMGIKVTTRKAPPPEKKVNSGGGSFSGGNSNAHLEKLRAQAEKTGNYSEVVKYKRELREKSTSS